MASNYMSNADYFSITDILATEERVACKIEITLPELGYLEVGSDSKDLKAGTKLELPLWLAQPMNMSQNPVLSIELPKIYKESYREILQADPCAVMLNKWNPYYYEVGMYLRQLSNPESEKVTETLVQAFKSRFRLIMDWAQNPVSDPTLGHQLPRLERDLFLAGRKAKVLLNDWLKKGTGSLGASEVATNLRKRKREEFELN